MTSIAALGLWFLAWAPNHHALWQRIESADELERQLVPWAAIAEPSLPLWIVWHAEADLLDSQPPSADRGGAPDAALYVSEEQWQGLYAFALTGAERVLPQLYVPRLILAPIHFRSKAGRFKKLEGLAPDSAERLLSALIHAHIDSRLRSDPTFLAEVDRQADALMVELEAPLRREAYLSAIVQFASHVLSISHEIGRHQRRRLARGETLCAVLDHPVSLFGSWRRAIEVGEYRGYRPSGRGGAAATGDAVPRTALGFPATRWGFTRAKLQRADKDWILGRLGVSWRGVPGEDFRFLCRAE